MNIFELKYFCRVSKTKIGLVSLKIYPNLLISIFLDTKIDPKILRKIDLNQFKMDFIAIRMDFSRSENPSKSI